MDIRKSHCQRCGHSWINRKGEPPVQCPKCRSPFWDKNKKLPCKFECIHGECILLDTNPKECATSKQVRIKIQARVYKNQKRSTDMGYIPPEKHDVELAFIDSANIGFVCPYCERPFNLWATSDLWGMARAASLDHLIPLRSGKSTNHRYNLQLCCHECNTVKGPTDPVYWKTEVDNLKKEHGLHGFWKWLDERYGLASSWELKSGWWEGKKRSELIED